MNFVSCTRHLNVRRGAFPKKKKMDQQAAGAEDPNKQPKKKSNDDDSKNKKLVCTYLAFFWGLRMYFTVNCTV